jgi:hypothetical protein
VETESITALKPPPATNPPCPFLPAVTGAVDHTITRRHRENRGADFYFDALRYAQWQWMTGKPAQAVLQLDKAWMADLVSDDPLLAAHPSPYAALAWIIRAAAHGGCGFLGDPVRHFQHLASRMSGPRSTVRSWRAWCCMHLAGRVSPPGLFRHDGRQLAREGLWIPSHGAALAALSRHGWAGEADIAEQALRGSTTV